jgi:hypothetical protein
VVIERAELVKRAGFDATYLHPEGPRSPPAAA